MAVLSVPAVLAIAKSLRASATGLVSWRNAAILLALINLKSLPFSWHFRLFYYFFANLRLRPDHPLPTPIDSATGKPMHPIFAPASMHSRTSLWETDYNLHKSNSTYFSDLDASRTQLVTRLYTPGVGLTSKELDAELRQKAEAEARAGQGPKKNASLGSMNVILGSVYCSFRREIKTHERYEISSRVLAWDEKWLYIVSFFLRPGRRASEPKTLLATGISKYVTKKGRLTVPPERVLRSSGFLPPRPEAESRPDGSAVLVESTPSSTESATPDGITASAAAVDGSMVSEILSFSESAGKASYKSVLEDQKAHNRELWKPEDWPWERIEEERKRGLAIMESFKTLDIRLYKSMGL